jgi:hypothetical protein
MLLKDGRTADELRVLFVAEGLDSAEVDAVLHELVALQRQAVAMDPAHLRADAQAMFAQGASVEHVVARFVQMGVAEVHARPEAERLHAAFRAARPCQRCGAPTPPSDLVYDLGGFAICARCNLTDEIQRSENRGLARDLEMIGGLAGGGLVASFAAGAMANAAPAGTSAPFCARCRMPSGVHVSRFDAPTRARLDPSWQWVCGRCFARIA